MIFCQRCLKVMWDKGKGFLFDTCPACVLVLLKEEREREGKHYQF